jgi:Arc/MetJ-type ribon-helix-helix transcriptional regulator
MSMARLKKMVSYALDPTLLDRLDKWLSRQDPAPSKTAVIESALRDWLDRRETEKRRPTVRRVLGKRTG